MNPVIAFLASSTGRVVRIVAGLALIAWAYFGLTGTGSIVTMVIGAIPFLAGIVDICVFAPLFGGPLSGSQIRSAK
jgi:hypothetical protein